MGSYPTDRCRWHPLLRALLTLVGAFVFSSPARSSPLFISVDEWGKGVACNSTTATVNIPLCNLVGGVGTFARLPSGFMDDPTPGGGTHVLTYLLPAEYAAPADSFDVLMPDLGMLDGDADLLRFIGHTLLFYSTQSGISTVDCSVTPFVMNSGCDGLADKKVLPPILPLNFVIPSLPPLGDESGLFISGTNTNLFEFNFQSDELTACTVPNCGPLNIAPPSNNPLRDITGLPGPNGGQPFGRLNLGVGGNSNNPFTQVPEPPQAWVVGCGLLLLFSRSMYRFFAAARSSSSF
jgi:hypothetical protein